MSLPSEEELAIALEADSESSTEEEGEEVVVMADTPSDATGLPPRSPQGVVPRGLPPRMPRDADDSATLHQRVASAPPTTQPEEARKGLHRRTQSIARYLATTASLRSIEKEEKPKRGHGAVKEWRECNVKEKWVLHLIPVFLGSLRLFVLVIRSRWPYLLFIQQIALDLYIVKDLSSGEYLWGIMTTLIVIMLFEAIASFLFYLQWIWLYIRSPFHTAVAWEVLRENVIHKWYLAVYASACTFSFFALWVLSNWQPPTYGGALPDLFRLLKALADPANGLMTFNGTIPSGEGFLSYRTPLAWGNVGEFAKMVAEMLFFWWLAVGSSLSYDGPATERHLKLMKRHYMSSDEDAKMPDIHVGWWTFITTDSENLMVDLWNILLLVDRSEDVERLSDDPRLVHFEWSLAESLTTEDLAKLKEMFLSVLDDSGKEDIVGSALYEQEPPLKVLFGLCCCCCGDLQKKFSRKKFTQREDAGDDGKNKKSKKEQWLKWTRQTAGCCSQCFHFPVTNRFSGALFVFWLFLRRGAAWSILFLAFIDLNEYWMSFFVLAAVADAFILFVIYLILYWRHLNNPFEVLITYELMQDNRLVKLWTAVWMTVWLAAAIGLFVFDVQGDISEVNGFKAVWEDRAYLGNVELCDRQQSGACSTFLNGEFTADVGFYLPYTGIVAREVKGTSGKWYVAQTNSTLTEFLEDVVFADRNWGAVGWILIGYWFSTLFNTLILGIVAFFVFMSNLINYNSASCLDYYDQIRQIRADKHESGRKELPLIKFTLLDCVLTDTGEALAETLVVLLLIEKAEEIEILEDTMTFSHLDFGILNCFSDDDILFLRQLFFPFVYENQTKDPSYGREWIYDIADPCCCWCQLITKCCLHCKHGTVRRSRIEGGLDPDAVVVEEIEGELVESAV